MQSMQPDDLDISGLNSLPVDWSVYPVTSAEQVVTRIQYAKIVLVNKVVLDAQVLSQVPNLKYIGVLATGTNNVDLNYCQQNNITVKNVTQYGTHAVTQHALAMLLALANRLNENHQAACDGRWSNSNYFCWLEKPAIELAGKHALILGYGDLGKRFAVLCEALGMRVTIASRPGSSHPNRPNFDDVLPQADVVSLHCLLSDETAQLMNRARFSAMKPSCILINTSRGGLVDEDALLWALETRQIGAAGLDVLCEEPPPRHHPLLHYNGNNLLITPHSAWGTREARQRLFDQALSNLAHDLTRRTE